MEPRARISMQRLSVSCAWLHVSLDFLRIGVCDINGGPVVYVVVAVAAAHVLRALAHADGAARRPLGRGRHGPSWQFDLVAWSGKWSDREQRLMEWPKMVMPTIR